MLVANLRDKTKYVIHIRNLIKVLNFGLILKKLHRTIEFNQNALLKPDIDVKKIFSSRSVMLFLEKLWKMWQKIDILNYNNRKKRELFTARHINLNLI